MTKPTIEHIAYHILYQEREIAAILDAVLMRDKVDK
jgi:hypothetical protein